MIKRFLLCQGINNSRMLLRYSNCKRRLFSGESSTKGDEKEVPLIPEATWSVQDLELSKQHQPVSEEELQILARRALLDLNQLDKNTRQQLRQDLGNMMNMIEQVKSFPHEEYQQQEDIDDYDAAMYDRPRGVTSAPLRTVEEDANHDDAETESKQVFDSFLKPQTTKVGAHDYFSIETKRESK